MSSNALPIEPSRSLEGTIGAIDADTLRAGDCVVQRGTWHAWRNRTEQHCLMSAVMPSAQREG